MALLARKICSYWRVKSKRYCHNKSSSVATLFNRRKAVLLHWDNRTPSYRMCTAGFLYPFYACFSSKTMRHQSRIGTLWSSIRPRLIISGKMRTIYVHIYFSQQPLQITVQNINYSCTGLLSVCTESSLNPTWTHICFPALSFIVFLGSVVSSHGSISVPRYSGFVLKTLHSESGSFKMTWQQPPHVH